MILHRLENAITDHSAFDHRMNDYSAKSNIFLNPLEFIACFGMSFQKALIAAWKRVVDRVNYM